MGNSLKVSVCIVAYNHEAFITQCVESALRQKTDFEFEVVVGEDCSTDRTLTMLQRLAQEHPGRLRIEARASNLGAERNFDTTIRECRGEYIAFLEGDNYWTAEDKLQRQVDLLDAHADLAFCFHRTRYVDRGGEPLPTIMPPDDPMPPLDIGYLVQSSNPVALGSVVARRALLDGLHEWVGGLKLGDWPLCLMLATRGGIGYVPLEMSAQRVHRGGAWQLLPPATQVAYVLQMLQRVVPLLPADLQSRFLERVTSLRDWWSVQAIHGEAQPFETTLRNLGGLGDPALDLALMTDLVRRARHDVESLKAEVAAGRTHQTNLESALLHTTFERNTAQNALSDLERQLARARSRPMKVLRDHLKFRTLVFLAERRSVVPETMAARFAKSARKRDPERSTRGFGSTASSVVGAQKTADAFVHAGMITPDPARRTILVVSHEASRTGAPILALNLAQALAERYNVVVLSLRGGNILEVFRETAIEVHVADQFHHDSAPYAAMIQKLCRRHDFAFSIVNSLESRGVLKGLNTQSVPIVTLVHEFASYTNPKTAFMEVVNWSTEAVFSTRVTLENALQENPIPGSPVFHVEPQGKCIVPQDARSDLQHETERTWLTEALRPQSGATRPFVVIGAGHVQIRKGVDLFIEVATRVLQHPDGANVRFAWIGGGYDPERDTGYSVYLRDQLRRARIEDRVQMLRETSEIELAYQLSDAFLLSSRLDPLPNVAIDALTVGLPVLCFDRTTGIADCLKEGGLGQECVASYIDTSEMAQKLLALAGSEAYRADVSARSRSYAKKAFDFEAYARRIEALALAAESKLKITT